MLPEGLCGSPCPAAGWMANRSHGSSSFSVLATCLTLFKVHPPIRDGPG